MLSLIQQQNIGRLVLFVFEGSGDFHLKPLPDMRTTGRQVNIKGKLKTATDTKN